MSIPEQTPIKSHTANGVTTVFAFDFYVNAAGDLVVQFDGVTKTLNVDYTVTGTGSSSGGFITATSAPSNGVVVTIYRDTALERLDDFQTGGALPADTLNLQLDRLWQALQEIFSGGKGAPTALRVPNGEVVAPLPVASARAGRLVGFDSLGRPIAVVPTAGDASALALDLVSTNTAAKGAGQVGFNAALSYAAGTVGASLKTALASSGGTGVAKRLKADYGAVGDGVADDSAAFTNAIANVPEGGTLILDGLFRIASTVTVNRRVSLFCFGANEGVLLDVGAGNDGLVFFSASSLYQYGLNGLDCRINVYGRASACRNAVILRRVDRSRMFINVRAGAAQYGVVLDGCLINRIHIESTVNYNPPISTPGTQTDHVLIQKHVATSVATNINEIYVNLEGARNGIVISDMPGEGGNSVRGCIEGLTGKTFDVGECEGLHITDFWGEANGGTSVFNLCRGLRIGPSVNSFDGLGRIDDWSFTNTRGLTIDGYYGGYNIASSCTGTTIGQVGTPDPARNVCADVSAIQQSWLADSASGAVNKGGEGLPVMDTIFHNPFLDLWSTNGRTSGPPEGTQVLGGATATYSTAQSYPGNPIGCSASVITSGTTLDNGIQINPLNQPWRQDEYVSFMIPIYTLGNASGRVRVLVTPNNGASYQEIGWTPTVVGWTVIRGSVKLQAGQNWWIKLATWNGSAYTSGWQFYLGGVNIVRGPIPPKQLSDSLGRRAFIAPNITYAPDRFGMFAYTVAGKLYFASGTGAPGDWIVLN